jgi:hypothetical protein
MSSAKWTSGLSLRSRSKDHAHLRRRRSNHRFQAAVEGSRLEERSMLSLAANQFPVGQVAGAVPLSNIIWNGGPAMPGAPSTQTVESPSAAGAMKTVTLTNNSSSMIYPFIRGENIGQDPNATSANKYYDPQDATGVEYREYIGYQNADGNTYIGLPSHATITFQVPLVLWDGDNFYIATDDAYLTSSRPVYNYNPNASISVAGTAPSGTTPANTTTWITSVSNYPARDIPVVVFYRAPTPLTVLRAAAAQLGEWTYRDPYLTNFITDPLQTFPLINYDVSYVNNLTAPVSIEASNVPITVGNRLSTTEPPKYLGFEDYGWNPTNLGTTDFQTRVGDFVNNKKEAKIGLYFGGKGWPEYYNPNPADVVIPSGANVFLDSPLTDARSPYADDNNYYLLGSTSFGAGPIQLASIGGTYSEGNTIHFAANYEPELQELKAYLTANPDKTLVVDASLGEYPAGTKVTHVDVQDLTVTVKASHTGQTLNGVYNFVKPVNDYAVTDITRLWYSWANYYVHLYRNFKTETASASYAPTLPNGPTNEFTLTTAPSGGVALAVGMTVSGNGILPGTTILSIEDPNGNPVGSANAIGDQIFLSLVPSDLTPRSEQLTFQKPTAIPDTTISDTYPLTFTGAEAQQKARLFGGSVYAAMSAEAAVLQPSPLPQASALVGQVIQFYANLPTDGDTGGKNLTGQVRDVVKSILRGVWNFIAIPDQSQWYSAPATYTGGKDFNVYNLDPYVWFVHKVVDMSGYAFSVDDDVANPAAPGPVLASNSTPENPVLNHLPSNLQIAFGGIGGFGNPNEWFPTIPWGEIDTDATIGLVGGDSTYKNDYMITLTDPQALTLFNQINNPGDGQVGAYVSAPGYLRKGTTLIFKGPNGDNLPEIVLSQPPLKSTSTAIPIKITGIEPT